MTAACAPPDAIARTVGATKRKWPQVALQRLAKAHLKDLADALSRDESTVSRIRSGEARMTFTEFCVLLEALSMKAVDADSICVARDVYGAVATLAQAAMADEQTVRRLIWEAD